jgi:hypothetical protein
MPLLKSEWVQAVFLRKQRQSQARGWSIHRPFSVFQKSLGVLDTGTNGSVELPGFLFL